MGWHFKVGVRLASVLDPGGKDVNVGNSQVLDRIDFDLVGELAKTNRVQIRIGVARLALRRMAVIKS